MPNNTATLPFKSNCACSLCSTYSAVPNTYTRWRACPNGEALTLSLPPLCGSCHKRCTFIYSRAKPKRGQ